MPPLLKKSFRRHLEKNISASEAPLCIGIDLHIFNDLPPFFAQCRQENSLADFIDDFCTCVLDAIEPRIKIIKWQSAFFEACGWQGMQALESVTLKARERGFLNIYDAKRADIRSTMFAYGKAAFEIFHADAITITPYLGIDTIEAMSPWLLAGKGVYIVLLSSNPSGPVIQTKRMENQLNFAEFVGKLYIDHAQKSGYFESLGFVVGAPYFEANNALDTTQLHQFPLLIPGVGAQGFSLKSIKAVLPPQSPSLINVSRDILGIGSPTHQKELQKITSWSGYQQWVSRRLDHYLAMWKE